MSEQRATSEERRQKERERKRAYRNRKKSEKAHNDVDLEPKIVEHTPERHVINSNASSQLSLNQFRKQFCVGMGRTECLKALKVFRENGTIPREAKQEEVKQK